MAVTAHLKSLQALDLAVRCGSLKRAADRLAITPAAVGQRIKKLEDYLGMELIVRGRAGVKPTAALAAALPHLRNAFLELTAASDALDVQRIDEIHIAANSDWAELWLAPRLDAFRTAHPNIRFSINGEGDAPMRIGAADVEVVFRASNDAPDTDKLFRDYLVPICTPDNALRMQPTIGGNALEGLPLLHLDFYKNDPEAPDWPLWSHLHGQRRSARDRGIRFQRLGQALHAAASGAGFLITGLALTGDVTQRYGCVLPFPVNQGDWTRHAFQARFNPDALRRSQVRSFRAWLAAESRKTRNWIERVVSGEIRFGSPPSHDGPPAGVPSASA